MEGVNRSEGEELRKMESRKEGLLALGTSVLTIHHFKYILLFAVCFFLLKCFLEYCTINLCLFKAVFLIVVSGVQSRGSGLGSRAAAMMVVNEKSLV